MKNTINNKGGVFIIKYIENRNTLCHKCLKDSNDIKCYSIYGRGYGSIYDSYNKTVQLCKECRNDLERDLDKWFNEKPEYDNYTEIYKYEDKIKSFINSLPIQGREIVINQTSSGSFSYYCDSQDWIDIELNIANDEVYKRNGMYTPSEIKAYRERFPTCKNVYLKIWSDGSSSTKCKIHSWVSGTKNFTCNSNISKECYYCNYYEKKEENYIPDIEK